MLQSHPTGSKRTKIVNLSVCDHFAPLWTHRDPFWPFQTKIDFLLRSTLAKPYFVHLGQQIHFCLKWPKRVQLGPKGSQMVKNHSGRPFWSLLEYFRQACQFWSIMDHFLADPSQEQWTYASLLWLAPLESLCSPFNFGNVEPSAILLANCTHISTTSETMLYLALHKQSHSITQLKQYNQ